MSINNNGRIKITQHGNMQFIELDNIAFFAVVFNGVVSAKSCHS
ncbi:hypothetical protein [Methylobacter psychrophilus]|nr:hypothetical protein [Methylobacter psychrophilus]